jgi:hypothetical protein
MASSERDPAQHQSEQQVIAVGHRASPIGDSDCRTHDRSLGEARFPRSGPDSQRFTDRRFGRLSRSDTPLMSTVDAHRSSRSVRPGRAAFRGTVD